MTDSSIVWRRLDIPGHEFARVAAQGSFWRLSGTAVLFHERQPCRLDYFIACDSKWNTLTGGVSGWVGNEAIEIEYAVDSNRRWRLNGVEQPNVEGCIDIDLNFSPSTNLLPIRRLGLAVGEEGAVTAAWLRFPSFKLETLDQAYRRVDETTYRYESGGGSFVADLQVNEVGFVMSYGDLWVVER